MTECDRGHTAVRAAPQGASIYGAGSFAEVGILLPLPKEHIQWDPGTFEEETENARDTWEMLGGQEGLGIDPKHILAWGITSGPDILCWLTTDPDPDDWPVLWSVADTPKTTSLSFRGHGRIPPRAAPGRVRPLPPQHRPPRRLSALRALA
ncbi:hypothetical protein ACRYCC_17145 [Actinomadura scrupuli]|uniref:hypothetical protein n=1 Tax=Actinomadura scrupuli TaxID=559629 RepID=UPI003D991B18